MHAFLVNQAKNVHLFPYDSKEKYIFTYQPFSLLPLILRKQSADMVIWHFPFSLQHQCQHNPFFILIFILPTALLLCSAAVTFQYERKTEKGRAHFYSTKSEKGRNAKYFFLFAVSVDSFKCNKRRFCVSCTSRSSTSRRNDVVNVYPQKIYPYKHKSE